MEQVKIKKCAECGEVKQATPEYFHYASKKRNTFKKSCKKCSTRKEPYKWELVLQTGKKTCSKCKIEKSVEEFSKNKSSKDGYSSACNMCIDLHYVKPNHEKRLDYFRTRNAKNSQKRRDYGRKYYEENKDQVQEYKRNYYEKNKEEIKDKVKENHYNRRKTDPLYDLMCHMRLMVYRYIKKKDERTHEIIGCSPKELKEYIESLWLPGMTWDNHTHDGWHIDHIIPLCSAETKEEIYKLNHFSNLQPLWAKDNLTKGGKI
jgi:hypothetical protein